MSCRNLGSDPDPDPVGSVYYWLFWIRIRILWSAGSGSGSVYRIYGSATLLFGHHFYCPGSGSGSVFPIWIPIHGSHFNTDPHGCGSETLPKMMDLDPHWDHFRSDTLRYLSINFVGNSLTIYSTVWIFDESPNVIVRVCTLWTSL